MLLGVVGVNGVNGDGNGGGGSVFEEAGTLEGGGNGSVRMVGMVLPSPLCEVSGIGSPK